MAGCLCRDRRLTRRGAGYERTLWGDPKITSQTVVANTEVKMANRLDEPI